MNRYDAKEQPEAAEWLSFDEQHRISLVEQYHREERVKLPELKAHAVFHVIVENQLAEGYDPAVRAMARLSAEGLSRHDALHAIGSVLASHLHRLMNGEVSEQEGQAIYDAALEKLSAQSWLDG